jgi:hypothetical protein
VIACDLVAEDDKSGGYVERLTHYQQAATAQ